MPADLTRRLLFPEDRTAFIYQRPGEPILTPFRTGLQLFTDEACHNLADVVDEHGAAIPYSTVYTGDDSLLPLFYGPPEFVTLLWAKVVGGNLQAYPLVAQYGAQLQQVPTLLWGHGPPTSDIGVLGAAYLDSDALVIYGPKGPNGWPQPGLELQGPQGLPGGSYEHHQNSPSQTWVITHPLLFRPNVTVIDSAGFEVLGDISYPLPNKVVVEFATQLGGIALLS